MVTNPLTVATLGTLALACVLLHFLTEPIRWRLYAPKQGTLRRYIHVFNLAALVSHIAPFKLGLPTRLYLLRRALSFDLLSAGQVSLLDGLLYYSVWCIAAAVAVAAAPALNVNQHATVLAGLFALVLLIMLLALTGIFLWRRNRVRTVTANASQRSLRWQSFWRSRPPLSTLAAVGGVLLVDWGLQITQHVLILTLLGQPLDWLLVAGIVSISVFVGLLSMMPLGLGGYDATLTILLLSQGLALDTALAIPLINRLLILAVALALGLPAFSALGFSGSLRDWVSCMATSRRVHPP